MDGHFYRDLLKKTVLHITLEPGATIDDLTEDEAKATLEALGKLEVLATTAS